MVTTCDTLTIDALGSPASDRARRTLPGASASARFDVTTATMTVLMRLWLNGLDWTTSTGRRKPGPEPVGSGNDAHHTSPRFMAQCRVLRRGQARVNSRRQPIIDSIELRSYGRAIVPGQILFECFRKNLAARHTPFPGHSLGGIENRIWNRDGYFHTRIVLPKYETSNGSAQPGLFVLPAGQATAFSRERRILSPPVPATTTPASNGLVNANWR